MTVIKRKIHIIGINSFEFEELSKKLQSLFIKIDNIAVPVSYFQNIKIWGEKYSSNKKSFFASHSDNEMIEWIKSQKTM